MCETSLRFCRVPKEALLSNDIDIPCMSKRLLVIGGAVLLVGLLIAVWVYVMFIGTPRELPTGLPTFPWQDGAGNSAPVDVSPATTTEDSSIQNFSIIPLKQLTNRPVIGYREVTTGSSSSSTVLYYAEAGTGHIYEIDLTTGIETRRSGTTIVEAVEAVFSPDGSHVVFRSGYGRAPKTILGTLTNTADGLTTTDLGISIDQYTITRGNTLLYGTKNNVMQAFSKPLPNGPTQPLFTLPFREAAILWGDSPADTHIVFPRPSYLLTGFLYGVKNGKISRLPFSGYGLSAFRSGSLVGVGYLRQPEQYVSYFYDLNSKQTSLPGTFQPEKCAGGPVTPGTAWCAGIDEKQPLSFPDTWFRGELVRSDNLFTFSLSGSMTYHVNLQEESGRTVDIINPQSNHTGSGVYFINRLDNTLWRYLAS